MNLEQLKQLDEIAKQGTLSSASRTLHTSQSALSRSMQRLEAELGQQLFSRSKNSVELNEAGKIVVDHARAILREERFMHDALDRLERRESMIFVGTVAPAPLWELTALLAERFPGTLLSPVTLDEAEVIRRFVNRDIDIAITLEPLDLPTCRSTRLFDENLSVLLPKGHPLAGKESLTFSQLDGESFLVDSSAGFWLDVVRKRMPNAQFLEQSDRMVLQNLVSGTDLLAFTTDRSRHMGNSGTRACVPLVDGDATAAFYITARTDVPTRVSSIIDQLEAQPSARPDEA